MLCDLDEESRSLRIVSRSDKRHIRSISVFLSNRLNARIARRRQEHGVQSVRFPLVLESGDEECSSELSYRRDVCDVRPIQILVPLRIVIPHRVWPALDDRCDRFRIQCETFGKKNEIGRELIRLPARPQLRELPPDQPLHAAVVDEECGVSRTLHRALESTFHSPRVIAADEENSHRFPFSQSRAYFANTLTEAMPARSAPLAPSIHPPLRMNIERNRNFGRNITDAIRVLLPGSSCSFAHHSL